MICYIDNNRDVVVIHACTHARAERGWAGVGGEGGVLRGRGPVRRRLAGETRIVRPESAPPTPNTFTMSYS